MQKIEEDVLQADVWMASEGFAYYSQTADACFYPLGVRGVLQEGVASLHTPGFDMDEQALGIGVGLMAFAALRYLGGAFKSAVSQPQVTIIQRDKGYAFAFP